MRNFIKSTWRITLGTETDAPLVILDYGDMMLAEPTFPQTHSLQVQPFLRSDNQAVWDRGGITYDLTVSCVKTFDSLVEARNFMMSHMLLISQMRDGEATIEVKDGDSYSMGSAGIASFTPRLGMEVGASRGLGLDYRITSSDFKLIMPDEPSEETELESN